MTSADVSETRGPRWDLAPVFPSLQSAEFTAAHEVCIAGLRRLGELFDRHGVRADADVTADDGTVAGFEDVVEAMNALMDELALVTNYVDCLIAADSSDDDALGVSSRLQADVAILEPLTGRFEAWVASIGAGELISRSPVAAAHAHRLRRAEISARHQMSEPEEALAAELTLTGAGAWKQMWIEVTSQLTAVVTVPGDADRTLPMTAVRNLATDPSPALRRAAYDAELEAWESIAVTCAAAMNGVKGESIVLNRRRGWANSLEPSLHANNVDRSTLDAMHAAVASALPDFQRYLRAKAQLGSAGANGGLPWWDLGAPVGDPAVAAVSWEDACTMVGETFGTYSPALAELAARAVDERWIDAEERPGKVGASFCMAMRGGESRILMSFGESFGSVSTLAHELGHAYHNVKLARCTAMQRAVPIALDETASIFCETVLVQARLAALAREADPALRLLVLDADLANATQAVVDIHSRFLFERAVFAAREERALSATELCGLMTDAQAAAYGDGLDRSTLHPYMWAVKPHYYFTAYYNWPYTFGLLFGIGLYACYADDPDSFRQRYDDLLAAVGMGTAAELAGRFGIDIGDEAFWVSSLDVFRARVDEFESLVPPSSV